MSGTLSRAKLLVFTLLLLTLNTKLSADELGNAFKQLGLKGEISDGSFFGRYIEWRPPEKHASREQVIFYDADGNQHPFVLYRIKPDSRYAGQIRPATFLIGKKQYISLAHALASAKPGSTIEVSPGYFSLPPVHTAPNLESIEFFHRFTSVWASDDYAEFYLVPKETWVAFGSLSGITLRGSQGQPLSINPLAAVKLKNPPRQPDTQKSDNTAEEKNTDKSTSEEGERKGRFLGRLREGVAKLNLGDVQEGSILGMIQGGGSYPPLKHVLARWDAYMLPKVDYQSEEESVLISRPGSQFNRLGQGHKAKCPNWVHCADYAVANPLVISNSQDVTIENIDFAGPETSSFMGEGNGSALSLIAPMVAVMDSENVTFRNCTFSNAPGVGVLLRRSRRVTFENCVFLHGAEESIVATDTDVSIVNSVFLGNGRGKAIEHRVVTGDAVGEDIAPDSKYVQTTIEKFPQSAAIRLERSFAFAAHSLFKFSGTGAIDGDCRSELALVGNAFDEVTGTAVTIGTEAKKFEGNIIRGSVVCRDQLAPQCEAIQATLRGKNSFTDKAVSIEDVTTRFGARVTEGEWRPLSAKYWESAGGLQAACTQGPSALKYFLQMAFACREGWNGVLPDLTYFNLGSEDDRSALALGYAGCAALAKTVESGAKAAYELRSAGYTAAIRIHLYKEGILFRKPLKDFPLELTFEGRSISKFKTGDGGIFGDGSGVATVNFLRPGKYEIKSPLTDSVSVVLEDGLTAEVSLELK